MDVLFAIGFGNGKFYVMALKDYRSYTYRYTVCRDITSKEWHVPTQNEFIAFGKELNITYQVMYVFVKFLILLKTRKMYVMCEILLFN